LLGTGDFKILNKFKLKTILESLSLEICRRLRHEIKHTNRYGKTRTNRRAKRKALLLYQTIIFGAEEL
jgi:hypothetical protein